MVKERFFISKDKKQIMNTIFNIAKPVSFQKLHIWQILARNKCKNLWKYDCSAHESAPIPASKPQRVLCSNSTDKHVNESSVKELTILISPAIACLIAAFIMSNNLSLSECLFTIMSYTEFQLSWPDNNIHNVHWHSQCECLF